MLDNYTCHVLKKTKKIGIETKSKLKIKVLAYFILPCRKIDQMHTNKKDEDFIWYEEL